MKSNLCQLPIEILDQIVFYLAHSNVDVINFSICCKSIRSELLESNPLVIALRISSDIRKLGNVNCKRMKALSRKITFKKPDDEKVLKDNKRKFDEYQGYTKEKVKSNENIVNTDLFVKAFNITSNYYNIHQGETAEYKFEKWLTNNVESYFNEARSVTTKKTNAITKTDGIKTLWTRLFNEFFLFQVGQEICEIISKCVYEKVEYTSWNIEENEDAYPRYYLYSGEFSIDSFNFSFSSKEDENGNNDYWSLSFDDGVECLLAEGRSVRIDTTDFQHLKTNLFAEYSNKISNEIFLVILMSLLDFHYGSAILGIKEFVFT
ncbi:hypothetical protein ABK040_013783 [Willaertia magna]